MAKCYELYRDLIRSLKSASLKEQKETVGLGKPGPKKINSELESNYRFTLPTLASTVSRAGCRLDLSNFGHHWDGF